MKNTIICISMPFAVYTIYIYKCGRGRSDVDSWEISFVRLSYVVHKMPQSELKFVRNFQFTENWISRWRIHSLTHYDFLFIFHVDKRSENNDAAMIPLSRNLLFCANENCFDAVDIKCWPKADRNENFAQILTHSVASFGSPPR